MVSNDAHDNSFAEGREMKRRGLIPSVTRYVLLGVLAALAACAPKPPPAPPPAPPAIIIPPKPMPPLGAAPNLVLPPLAADGTRLTINTALSSKQALWNLRSAYNVAALNCQSPQHLAMAANYAAFLKANKKLLASVYKDLDKEFKKIHGAAGYIQKREVYQTQVYNYFAFPPVRPAFCDAMQTIGLGLGTIPSKSLEAQAPLELAKLEKLYQDFYVSYGKYRTDLAAWEAVYAPPAPALTSTATPPAPLATATAQP